MMSEAKAKEIAKEAGLAVAVKMDTRGQKQILVGALMCEWFEKWGGGASWRVEGSDRRGMFRGEAIAHAVQRQA